jgi:hypothetical protein
VSSARFEELEGQISPGSQLLSDIFALVAMTANTCVHGQSRWEVPVCACERELSDGICEDLIHVHWASLARKLIWLPNLLFQLSSAP